MTKNTHNTFGARGTFDTGSGEAAIYRLAKLQEDGIGNIERVPYSIKILLESLLRNENGFEVSADDITTLAGWDAKNLAAKEIPFLPARVILQDFTGVPALVDLAALRSAMQRLGGDPALISAANAG